MMQSGVHPASCGFVGSVPNVCVILRRELEVAFAHAGRTAVCFSRRVHMITLEVGKYVSTLWIAGPNGQATTCSLAFLTKSA